MEDVVIVGAGIAGLATAVALKRVGIRALVLERADKLRVSGAALNLAPNAWIALDALGVSHKLFSLYPPFSRGTVTNVVTGQVQDITFPPSNIGLRSVHRRVLLQTLAEELPTDSIRFSSKLSAIGTQDEEGFPIPVLHLEDGTTIKAKVLIGCDGRHSKVGRWLGLSEPIHSGRSAVVGLTSFPQGHDYELQQFVDTGRRAGIARLNDKEVYWFLTCAEGKDITRDPELIQQAVIEKYAKDLPSKYIDIVRQADASSLTWTPLMLRQPWNVIFGTLSKGNITVAGDAMHPMTPDLGQGGCSALEDSVVLGRHIGNSFIKNGRIVPKEMPGVLNEYVKERRYRVAALITGSYISGRVQQGSSWLMRFVRDTIFYGFLFRRALSAVAYDCGELPSAIQFSSNKTD
ncbi:FAD/NAD(P)-binding oxidoreductase family protein [Euphorbia peplus]|nr:FAD/NAD(P)-binding oxidoreductase family protein [Euphorbia peplus]